jgi:hypothetical protein
MTGTIELLDLIAPFDSKFLPAVRSSQVSQKHECDGCGQVKTDVDIWAEDFETGEAVWLCLACGD